MNRTVGSIVRALSVTLGLLISFHSALGATPDFLATVVQPVDVAAAQNALFVTQPFCVNDSQTGPVSPSVWRIMKIDNAGTQTVFAQFPDNPDYGLPGTPGILSPCEESHVALAPLNGIFTAGDLFATQGGHIYEFNPSGVLVRTILIPSLEVPLAHTALVFDKVGTFAKKLIIVGTNISNAGEVWSVDPAGNTTKLFTLTGPFAGNAACAQQQGVPCIEIPDIAPTSGPIGGTFPGALFMPLEGLSGVAADIGALSPPPGLSFSAPGGLPVPEAVHFIPSSFGCGFQFIPNGQNYVFINANFVQSNAGAPAGNAIYGYKAADFAGLGGQLLVTSEAATPSIFVSTSPAIAFSVFDPADYNAEGSSFLQCLTVPHPVSQSVTVEEFQPSPLDGTHLSNLEHQCEFLLRNDSGSGVCTCGVGDSALTVGGGEPAGGTSKRFQVSYFDVGTSTTPSAAGYGGPGFSGGAGDNTVRIINPTAANGNLCAMIYVFDDTEEMQTCCGCPVTPDGMRTLSVTNDLTFDFGVNKANLNAGVIDIVSSLPNFNAGNPSPGPNPPGTNGGCSPTGSASSDAFHRSGEIIPTNGLDAWITLDEGLQPGNLP